MSDGITHSHITNIFQATNNVTHFASRELIIQYGGPPDLSTPFQNAWG